MKLRFIGSGFSILLLSSSLIGCSNLPGSTPEGCEINGSPRTSCSAEWVRDEKGNLLVVTWPDGEKSTIRPSGASKIDVVINEKDAGKLIENSSFLRFKNSSSGSVISISPVLAGDFWSEKAVNLSKLSREQKEQERRRAQSEQKRRSELEAKERLERKRRSELEAKERLENLYLNPIARLTVKQLANEFEANSIVAEEKYANQMVSVSGVIDSVDDSMFNQDSVTVRLGVPDGYQCFGEFGCTSMPDMSFSYVSCSHSRSEPILRELRKGMKLEVRGSVYSESTGVRLKKCRYYKS